MARPISKVPPDQAVNHVPSQANLPDPMDLPDFLPVSNVPDDPGPPSLSAHDFEDLSLPDAAAADVDIPAADLPDFIFDLG